MRLRRIIKEVLDRIDHLDFLFGKPSFLKHLESSVDSFRLTLQRTIEKIDRLENRITAFEKHLDETPEIDYDALTPICSTSARATALTCATAIACLKRPSPPSSTPSTKRTTTSLLSSRGAMLPTMPETPTSRGTDFDLVT